MADYNKDSGVNVQSKEVSHARTAVGAFIDPNIKRKDNIMQTHIKGETFPIFSLFEFDICGVCNRHCKFCPRYDPKKYKSENKYISLDLYRKIMAQLKEIEYAGMISYSGFSEPFLHKDLVEIIRLTRQACPKSRIEIYTNGDFVALENLKAFFDAGLSSLQISLYDGPKQIDKFTEMKNKLGLNDDQIGLRKRYLSREEGYGLTISNRAGLIDFEGLGIDPIKEPLKRQCFYPFYTMIVDYNGDVLACTHDFMKRLVLGNLNNESIMDVWNGEKIRRLRERLGNADRNFEPCNLCDIKGTLLGGEHYKLWKEYYDKRKK
ncbi:MAG: SPASM domain-containing protein [Candidatus Aenigmarchaeota archaeon]|nr:SPASM domain-containing protein [Candidatus Aenigmarchaeota archaeon]